MVRVEPVGVGVADRVDLRRRTGVFVDLPLGNQRSEALRVFQRHVQQLGGFAELTWSGMFVGKSDRRRARCSSWVCRCFRARGDDDDAVGALRSNTAVAEASFSTEIVATSFGSRSESCARCRQPARGVRAVPARYAAHVELHVVVAGLAARLNARDARKFAGDGLRDVGRSRIDQFVGADLGDGAQDALLLLDAVAYDDDIIDLLSLFDKRYGQGFPPLSR